MDAHRSRRTRDQARKTWYASHRQVRFARWLGFIEPGREDQQTSRLALSRVMGVGADPRAFRPAAESRDISVSGPAGR